MTTAIIKLVGTTASAIDEIAKQIKSIAGTANIKMSGPVPLPTTRIARTTRKTPCGDGSHTYEKWELRIHKRLLIIAGDEQALRQIMRIHVPDTVKIEISLAG
jgi:small subunit ribosomal protein S10